MRLPLIIVVLVLFGCSSAFCITDAGYDAFIKSREVVETLYFKSNSDSLTKSEQSRLSNVISRLKDLQENGRLIRIEGFSSPDGDKEANFKLSFYRAKTVADLIQSNGLSEEVTVSGYGDLRSGSREFQEERRVEIVSYNKPPAMQRIKVVDNKQNFYPETEKILRELEYRVIEIDSYHVDQAIRSKVDDDHRGLVDDRDEIKDIRDLSQQDKNLDDDLEKGYTLWRKSVDPDYSPKVTQVVRPDFDVQRGYSQTKPAATEELQRGYSQTKPSETEELQRGYSQTVPATGYSEWQKAEIVTPKDTPELSQVEPVVSPSIDALMIEQAIMEKIGAATIETTGALSQVSNIDFQSENSSN